jgi:hypothetical protein
MPGAVAARAQTGIAVGQAFEPDIPKSQAGKQLESLTDEIRPDPQRPYHPATDDLRTAVRSTPMVLCRSKPVAYLRIKEKAFIVDLRTRAVALKLQGVDAEKAGGLLTAEFKTKYPDWPSTSVTNFVKSIYAE